MNKHRIWESFEGKGPIGATAIHSGHRIRKEVKELMALDDADRLREEDPCTNEWTSVGDTRINVLLSRFEVDLNRPREKAVYIDPEDAWGLHVWKTRPAPEIIAASLEEYDAFYTEVRRIFSNMENKFGRFVVFDLHSYNHRRQGPDGPTADLEQNPEVNIGTGTMKRERWAPLVDRFIKDLSDYPLPGHSLDVRENVKFKGGQFGGWIHQTFPESACCLSIEFKKFFMDEWSGKPNHEQIGNIRSALLSTVPGLQEELKKMGAAW